MPVQLLNLIETRLSGHKPGKKVWRRLMKRSAVALILQVREGELNILMIKRAEREGDPWSGHMAFPGGRVDPQDADTRSAAERETLEEVGVSLETARCLGRLEDLEERRAGKPAGMVISGYVYELRETPRLEINREVEMAFWFPLRELLDRERHVGYQSKQTARMRFPGVLVGEPGRHIVWGLTYRFLEVFFEALGRELSAK